MILFVTPKPSKFRGVKNINPKSSKPDIFSVRKGPLYGRRLKGRVRRLPIPKQDKEVVNYVLEKYQRRGTPGGKGVTREELLAGLAEMAENPNDSVSREDVKRIKEHL